MFLKHFLALLFAATAVHSAENTWTISRFIHPDGIIYDGEMTIQRVSDTTLKVTSVGPNLKAIHSKPAGQDPSLPVTFEYDKAETCLEFSGEAKYVTVYDADCEEFLFQPASNAMVKSLRGDYVIVNAEDVTNKSPTSEKLPSQSAGQRRRRAPTTTHVSRGRASAKRSTETSTRQPRGSERSLARGPTGRKRVRKCSPPTPTRSTRTSDRTGRRKRSASPVSKGHAARSRSPRRESPTAPTKSRCRTTPRSTSSHTRTERGMRNERRGRGRKPKTPPRRKQYIDLDDLPSSQLPLL